MDSPPRRTFTSLVMQRAHKYRYTFSYLLYIGAKVYL